MTPDTLAKLQALATELESHDGGCSIPPSALAKRAAKRLRAIISEGEPTVVNLTDLPRRPAKFVAVGREHLAEETITLAKLHVLVEKCRERHHVIVSNGGVSQLNWAADQFEALILESDDDGYLKRLCEHHQHAVKREHEQALLALHACVHYAGKHGNDDVKDAADLAELALCELDGRPPIDPEIAARERLCKWICGEPGSWPEPGRWYECDVNDRDAEVQLCSLNGLVAEATRPSRAEAINAALDEAERKVVND